MLIRRASNLYRICLKTVQALLRFYRLFSFCGFFFIIFLLVILLLPSSIGAVNTNFIASFWSMPIIYNMANGSHVSLFVNDYGNKTVETQFRCDHGVRDAVTASFTGITYKEGNAYFDIINREVHTEHMPYVKAIADFNVKVILMKNGDMIDSLYIKDGAINLHTPCINFSEISERDDGNYTLIYKGIINYHIDTIIERRSESHELNFGYLNITVKDRKTTYVHHRFKGFSETLNVKTINPILFKTKKMLPLVLLVGAVLLQIPAITRCIKFKKGGEKV